ncbi:GNAT family N-acetyltransferase [soil metagenome]
MKLRRFQTGDAIEIASLFLETVRRINGGDYSPREVAAWAPEHIDVGALGRRQADSYGIVAEVDGEIVGFGNVEESGHLDCLYVHADFPQRGIGSRILERLEAKARRSGVRRLFTEASITARPFFERRGYTVLERQQVEVRGVALTNFRMEKFLKPNIQRGPKTPTDG